MGRSVSEKAHLPTKRKGQTDGVDVRDFDITELDGPATDAIVRVLGAVSRGGRAGLTCGVMLVRTFHRLGCPANEGAGQDEAGQEGGEDRSHRLRHLNSRISTLSLNGRAIPVQVKRDMRVPPSVPKKTPRLIIVIGRHCDDS
jgi:hypothetical protein